MDVQFGTEPRSRTEARVTRARTGLLARVAPRVLRPLALSLIAAFGLALVLACDADEPAARDAKSASPQRIASLSKLSTGLLLELGAADRIIAVDAASRTLPGLAHRPLIPDDDASAYLTILGVDPGFVVLPESRAELAGRLATANVPTVIEAIHDIDDGFTLWGELAGRIGVAEAMRERIAEAARPFGALAAESSGFTRPRVAVIAGFEPLTLVGDHRFATALVEMAGGENVTHGQAGDPIATDPERLRRLAPELLVHARPTPIPEAEREALASSVAAIAPLVVVEIDPARFYDPTALAAARALRAAIAPLARPLADPPSEPSSKPLARPPGSAPE